ncbi:MAG: glycosyltransferase family 4 protein [Paludibacteraceae bacterium]|nr:glycosyltransferase family 4 protein [Paludibacteraceae bacterium]
MKILLVTTQLLEDRGNTYFCSANFYDILKRFSYIGELFLYSGRYTGNNSHTKIDKDLNGIVKYGNAVFRVPSVTDVLFISKTNKRHISELIASVDLVISYGSSYGVYKLAKAHNKPFMSYVVSCAWDAFWNHGWQGKLIAPYKFLLAKYTIKHSDYVLYVSNRFLQERYPTNAKYQVGCSDVKIKDTDDDLLKRRLDFYDNWDGNTLNVATTAAVDVRYKGHEFVFRALFEMKKMGRKNVHYYLLGGGDPTFLKGLVAKYGIEEQVHFKGIVPHDEVFEILDLMHVYIQPSLQEGLPRSMVEAMSRGLMCVGANTAAIPELIESKYVVRRKSYEDIANILLSVTRDEMKEQANINFQEAKKYKEEVINARRLEFFDKIIDDIKSR